MRKYLIIIALIGSAFLGGASINRVGYWYDEVASMGFINDSATWYKIAPEQGPVYYLLLRGWVAAVGDSEVAGRWLSLLFGLLTLAVTYRLAAVYVSAPIALMAVTLLGSSAFFLRYYREIRPYMLLVACCTLSMWFFLEWLYKRRLRDGALYVTMSLLSIYTHAFAGLVIAAQGVYFLLREKPVLVKRDGFVRVTIGLFGAIVLALLPYLSSFRSGAEVVTSGRFNVWALTPPEAVYSMAVTLTNDSLAVFLILILLAVLAQSKGVLLALLWAFLPLAVVLFVHTYIYRIFAGSRYLIFIWPPFAILAAMGLSTLRGRAMHVALLVLVGVGIVQVQADLPHKLPGVINNPPWREMFETIGQRAEENSLVFVNMVDLVGLTGYREPMLYYFDRFMSPDTPRPVELDFPPRPEQAALAAMAADANAVWLIATDGVSNERGEKAREALHMADHALCRTWEYSEPRAYLSYWGQARGETAHFENGFRVHLAPLNHIQASYAPGQTLELALGLYTEQPLLIDYSLAVYLFDSNGRLVVQSDGPVANTRTSAWGIRERYCDFRTLQLPQISGDYTVRTTVYDSIANQRVAVISPESPDNLVTLFTIRVK